MRTTFMRGIGITVLAGLWMTLAGFGVVGNPGDCRVNDAAFQSGGGGCMDTQTGRSWDASSHFNGAGHVSWTYYRDFCKNRVVGGFDDWRLPTKAELEALAAHETLVNLVELGGENPTTMHVVTLGAARYKWSSEGTGSKKWGVDGYGSSMLIQTKPAGLLLEGLCVR